MNFHHLFFLRVALLSLTLSLCLPAAASLVIDISEPQWRFLLLNRPLGNTETQLRPEEGKFAAQIQPLLAQQDYAAVRQAFAARPLADDSPALQQLRGQVLLSLKHYDEAEQALLAALQNMPDLALSHRSLGLLYMVNKDYVKARRHLRRSIELGTADAQIYGQLAYVNLKTDSAASAVAGYQHALFLEPENRQWRQGLLYALLNSKALDQAQALVAEMLKNDEYDVSLWLIRSQIALNRNRNEEALSSLEMALQLGAEQVPNIVAAAQLHLQYGSMRRAVDLLVTNNVWRRAEAERELLSAVQQIAGYLAYQRQWSELSRLLSAIDKQQDIPLRSRVSFNVYAAQLAMEEGKLRQAQKALQAAVDADPVHGEALLALGDLYHRQQQSERARTLYVRAAALAEFRARALLSHAQLEIDRAAYPEALELLRQVAQLNPSRSDVVSNIRALENLINNRG